MESDGQAGESLLQLTWEGSKIEGSRQASNKCFWRE